MNYVKQFIGKVCTVIVGPINRDFKDEAQLSGKPQIYPMNLLDHFMGRVIYADPQSLVLQHPVIGTQTWFNLSQVVCIAEEQELDPDNPEHAKAIESYKRTLDDRREQQQNTPVPQSINSQFSAGVLRIACPSCKRGSKIPPGLEEGTLVQCPFCQYEFKYTSDTIASEKAPTNFVDINSLQNLANEAKD